jgi:SprB repeat
MKFFNLVTSILLFIIATILISGSCGKGGTPPPPDPCSGITVAVSGTTTNPTTLTSSDGTITVSATGGSGFTYNLNGGTFQSSISFTGLAAGSYIIIAKNSNGCTGSATFTLTGANPCAGISIAITGTIINPTTILTNNGSINATATGSSGFTFSLNGGAFQGSGNFVNLGVGSYTVTAKDLNGCTGSAVFTLTAPNPCAGVTITITAVIINPTASGATNGSIAASASGGAGSYTFNINGGAFQASGTFSNLGAGNYTISAKDANGCTGSAAFTLTVPNPCTGVTITVSNVTTNNTPCQSPSTGSITVTPSGGTGPYTYRLNSGTFQPSNIFSNLVAGNYTITAKDVNGCTGSNNALVQDLPEGPLFALVRTVLQNNCVSCHNSIQTEGGMNWTIDCNIVTFKTNIKNRAVDGIPSSMPPSGLIPASERAKITNWINAGGRFTD